MSSQLSQPGPSRSTPNLDNHPRSLDNFRVLKWDGVPGNPVVSLNPADVEFPIVTAAVHFALLLLEKKEGKSALKRLGLKLCEIWHKMWVDDDDFFPDTAKHIVEGMESLVNSYLESLRSGFFHLVITELDETETCCIVPRIRLFGCDYKYAGASHGSNFHPQDLGALAIDNQGPSVSYSD